MKHLTILLLLLCPALVFAQYEIGHQTFSINDASRGNREITGHIYYPAESAGDDVDVANAAFPFISFGHGFGMAWSEYEIWWQTLVPKGYVIAFATTENSIFPFPSHADFGEDLAFVINSYMDENMDANSDFYQRFSTKNAVMGHSMGGGSSYLAAGSFSADVETVISLAAADTDPSAIQAADNITVPVLTIAGSADCVVMEGGAPIDIYNGLNHTEYKAYVEITDASHCQFGIATSGSICTFGEFCSGFLSLEEQHLQMFLNTEPWLDYFLKEDCAAWDLFHENLTTSTAHTYQETDDIYTKSVEIIEGDVMLGVSALIGIDNPSYQWLLNGNAIDGATMETYDVIGAQASGIYTLLVTDGNGCEILSNEIIYIVASVVSTIPKIAFKVYPTLIKDDSKININTEKTVAANINIIDDSGKIVYQEAKILTNQTVHSIDISYLSKGIYFIQIASNKDLFTQKIIKTASR